MLDPAARCDILVFPAAARIPEDEPVLIDPHAWMLTLPLTIVLTWLYFEPEQSTVRQIWREMTRLEQEGLAFLGLQQGEWGLEYATIRKVMYLMVVAACAGTSALSIAAAVGVLPMAA